MECEEFLEGYSSYTDGLLDPGRERRFERHLEGCDSCSRYDRVIQRGTEILRDLPRARPSSDFLPRLRHRLYHLQDGIPMEAARGGGAAAVAVAAVGILALSWLPFAASMPVEVELPAVAVEVPAERGTDARTPSLFEPGPVLGSGLERDDGSALGWNPAASLLQGAARRGPGWTGLQSGGPSFLATTRAPLSPAR